MPRRCHFALPILLAASVARAADAPPTPPADAAPLVPHLAQFGAGDGPAAIEGGFRLLDAARTPGQSNAVGFDLATAGLFARRTLTAKVKVEEGGDGGAFLFLDTRAHGTRGPAPFVPEWTAPSVAGAFAVALDVHNPPSEEMFTPWGNYQDLPQREVSLHWDGREVAKRVAPAEFRGREAALSIEVRHVVGGAEVTVELAGATVYDRTFVAGLAPFEARLAVGAGTRADATTTFDVTGLRLASDGPTTAPRPPLHVEVFHHVRTDNQRTAHEAEVDLPPAAWAFGRVLLTLDLHDAGDAWDEWDRNGEVSVVDDAGRKLGIVPFITSYRTPCHWVVDVTDFRPLLAGRRRFEIAAGTNFYKGRGYLMSVALDFHPGTPERVAAEVVPLWVGTATYRSAENHFRDFFEPRTVAVGADVVGARFRCTTTGHSQVGEFTPSKRALVVERAAPAGGAAPAEGAAAARFEHTLWKTDCYLNANRPQFGTWQFARAGWAPGDVVRPWEVDLSAEARAGTTVSLRYVPEPYAFPAGEKAPPEGEVAAATHVVRAYLVLFRAPTGLVDAPTLRVTDVVADGNAARAGVKAGDYLSSYDGRPVATTDELRAAVKAAQTPGREDVPVVLYRGADRLELRLRPGLLGVHLSSR
ncbi:MAG: PDZ domain-containing protein [Planctomycetia bacterium]|nr:PDZ domain-containing protein [Planctomycetia bacterium]